MRELWWAACGRLDADMDSRAFWMGVFGQSPSPDQFDRMHPLRRLERADREAGRASPEMVARTLDTLFGV